MNVLGARSRGSAGQPLKRVMLRLPAFCLLFLVSAPCRGAGGGTRASAKAWCADAPRPAIGKVKVETSVVGPSSILVSPEGDVLFAFTAQRPSARWAAGAKRPVGKRRR